MNSSVYEKYGLSKIINASGKMTILGGSRLSKDIAEALAIGGQNFYEVKDLLDKTGEYIAKSLNVESSYIVSSASSGIAQSIASTITGDNLYEILHLNNTSNRKREIIIPKGHNVDYGTPVEVTVSVGGGVIREAGYANKCTINHVKSMINENTAALLYIKSHHCVQKEIISVEDYIKVGQEYSLPVIVDAAAEEDLTKYYKLGADAVIYSGTKALEGPTSGIVIGKKNFIDRLKLQGKGIGRVMKVGKENIVGLTRAIEIYTKKSKLTLEEQKERLTEFNIKLNAIDGIEAKCVRDSSGREIIRCEISFNEEIIGKNSLKISEELKSGDIKIYTRDYRANEGKIEIDIRDVNDKELNIIFDKIAKIIER